MPAAKVGSSVDHFVQKPFMPSQVVAAVERLTGGANDKYGHIAH